MDDLQNNINVTKVYTLQYLITQIFIRKLNVKWLGTGNLQRSIKTTQKKAK